MDPRPIRPTVASVRLGPWALAGVIVLGGCPHLASGTLHAEPVLAVSIEVRARAFAPGEPMRVRVDTDAPVARLTGEFLGRPFHLVPLDGAAGGIRRWSGWSMIGLDDEPQAAAVTIRGRTPGGRQLAGTHAVRIAERAFPTETLSVAPRYVEPPPEVRRRLALERRKLAAVYAERTASPPAAGPFVRPVDGAPTSIFGTRRVYNGKPRAPHPGLDLRAATGTPVASSGPGRVVVAEDLYYSGNTVIVDHGGGLFTIYAHLSEIAVDQGRPVRAGEHLGLSGATGRVTGPHLHWGAKIGERPFDPTALLDRRLFP